MYLLINNDEDYIYIPMPSHIAGFCEFHGFSVTLVQLLINKKFIFLKSTSNG